MRTKLSVTALVAAVALVALAPLASAGAKVDRATGGGQVLVGTRGAGDTVAFTAQGTAAAAKGQVQYVDRTGGTGRGQSVFHGRVTCLAVVGNTAKIAGVWERGDGQVGFELLVQDNGEGAAAATDLVTIQHDADPTCSDDDDDPDNTIALARGNAQVYDAE